MADATQTQLSCGHRYIKSKTMSSRLGPQSHSREPNTTGLQLKY